MLQLKTASIFQEPPLASDYRSLFLPHCAIKLGAINNDRSDCEYSVRSTTSMKFLKSNGLTAHLVRVLNIICGTEFRRTAPEKRGLGQREARATRHYCNVCKSYKPYRAFPLLAWDDRRIGAPISNSLDSQTFNFTFSSSLAPTGFSLCRLHMNHECLLHFI